MPSAAIETTWAVLLLALSLEPQTPVRPRGARTGADARVSAWRQERKERIERAWNRLQDASHPRWKVFWNQETGLPGMVFGSETRSLPGPAEPIARAFLEEHPELFGLDEPDATLSFQCQRNEKEWRSVHFQCRYKGVEVFGSAIMVMIDNTGRIRHITSSVHPVAVELQPRLTPDEAVEFARSALNAEGGPVAIQGTPRLVIVQEGEGRLAYLASASAGPDQHPRQILIDGRTGSGIRSWSLVQN
jgi:Zn-dependent metalloprotease